MYPNDYGTSIMASIQAQMQYDCTPDAETCWCRGSGWVLTDWDSFHQCPCHPGKPHPEVVNDVYDAAHQWAKENGVDDLPGLVDALVEADLAREMHRSKKPAKPVRRCLGDDFCACGCNDDLPF
jgi:hypothetical protein